MKIAIAAVLTVIVGLGAVVGVYQFRESRMTPADLDAMRQANLKLAEAERAAEEAKLTVPEEESEADPIEMAQAETAAPEGREWKQIDTPPLDPAQPFYVKFACSMGDFVVEFHPDWAPNGAKRVHELIDIKFLDDCRFFRVIPGFMAQFGISGDPGLARKWDRMNIQDDPVKESNKRGYVTFAQSQFPNSRSTQMFINYEDRNQRLDGSGFAPVGKVIEGMEIVDKIYSGYGGSPDEGGQGPRQDLIQSGGTTYLNEFFPKLDYIKKARFVEPVETEAGEEDESEAA